jgi:transposase
METILTNFQWAHLAPLLPGWEGTNSKHGRDNRQFVEAEFWLARDGARWRALHKERGNWHTMYKHSAGLPQACGNARSKPYRTKLLCTCSWSTQPRCERTSTRAGRTKKHRKPSGTAAAGQRVRCIWTVTPAAHRLHPALARAPGTPGHTKRPAMLSATWSNGFSPASSSSAAWLAATASWIGIFWLLFT